MPKSAPKQKTIPSKKKMPTSILGLLGLALVLVGIVAAIGLMQISQDGRSNAANPCDGLSGTAAANCSASNDYDPDQTQEENYERLRNGNRANLDEDGQAAYDKQAVAAAKANQAANKKQNRTRSTALVQPTSITASCERTKIMRVNWKMVNGSAEKFVLAANSNLLVPGSSGCQTLGDGWRCQGDIQIEKSASSVCNSSGDCSTTLTVWKAHTYDTVVVRAVKSGANKSNQIAVNLKCV